MCKFKSANGTCKHIVLGILLSLGLCSTLASQEERTWTSHDGAFKTKGTIISATEERVQLRRSDNNKIVVVNVDRLTLNDQKYVKDFIGKTQKQAAKQPTKGEPSVLPKMAIKKIDDQTFQIGQLGTIGIPEPGLEWLEEVGSSPQKFVAQKEGKMDKYVLTFLPTAVSSQDRIELMKENWEVTSQAIERSGSNFKNQVLPFTEQRAEFVEWLSYEVELSAATQRNLIAYGFMAGMTLRIHHEGPSARMGDEHATNTLRNFKPLVSAEKKQVPLSVQREVQERIQLLKSLVDADDYGSILLEFTNATDFRGLNQGSELERNTNVESFKKTNRPFMKMLVQSLDISKAIYDAREDVVLFVDSKPLQVQLKKSFGRWTLPYPKILPQASAADIAKNEPTQGESSKADKGAKTAIPTGNDLRLEKIDDKWVSFLPYGPVPVLETGFEWKIVSTSPPRIVAAKQTLDKILNFDEEIAIEILPPTAQNGKLALVKSKSDNVSERMKGKKLGPIISSIESIENSTVEIKERAGFDVEGWQSSAAMAGYRCDILFLGDKTIVMEVFCQGNSRENRERAFRMGLALHDAIASKPAWYPKSGIPPEIKQGLEKSIKELLELVHQEKYAEIFEKILPSEEFQKLKSNPDQFKGAIEQFKTRKSIELVQSLKNLDWDIARYDATDDSVTFPANARPMTFKRIMGRWTMR